ncbi:UvrD-helicase domain-containing protein, partial [bacterium]|nr:UvrD-helicase domain-containing protein [bacterium]
KYILVDEYQDTNYAQYQLVKTLASKYRNICVVGDPDQSIYSWRGADITNILNFEKDYDNAVSIKLEQNYRSREVILDSANKVIEKNIDRHPKELKPTRMGGDKIVFYSAIDSKDEAEFICDKIKEYQNKGVSLSEIAIFYRMHALSRGVEETLLRNQIPYEIVGGIKFYDRKEIKDILAYLRFACNPADKVSFERIINVPKRAIGKATVSKIIDFASSSAMNISDALKNIKDAPEISTAVSGRIQGFLKVISNITNNKNNGSIADLLRDLIEKIQYEEYLKDFDLASSKDRIDNVRELVSSIAEYEENTPNPSLQEYLNNIALISDLDSYEQDPNKVTLMTLHNAKGLEFDLCFVMALEEGIFPHSLSNIDDKELEEERRLCYVGITRAKEYLILTAANRRLIYGRWTSNDPSRFLFDIPDENIDRVTGNTSPFAYADDFSFKPDVSYEDNDSFYAPHLTEGVHVFHSKWGMGRIMQRSGNTEVDAKVKIQFQASGLKELMLKYANLSVI